MESLERLLISVSSFSSPVLTSTFSFNLTTVKSPLTVSASTSFDSSLISLLIISSSVLLLAGLDALNVNVLEPLLGC